jgi:cleavage and polyadenylation specificity factor subunit 1
VAHDAPPPPPNAAAAAAAGSAAAASGAAPPPPPADALDTVLSRFEFERSEHVLCMAVLPLRVSNPLALMGRASSAVAPAVPYLVVGTGMLSAAGEDDYASGRLLLFEISGKPVVPQQQQQLQAGAAAAAAAGGGLSLLLFKKMESQVTAVAATANGNIVAAVGMQVIVYSLPPEKPVTAPGELRQPPRDLDKRGACKAGMFVMSLSVLKNYVLVGDAYRSVQFLQYKEADHTLTLRGKDFDAGKLSALSYCVFDRSLGLVSADVHRNLQVLQYAPQAVDSRNGEKLLVKADFHLGALVTSMARMRMRANPFTSAPSAYALPPATGAAAGPAGIGAGAVGAARPGTATSVPAGVNRVSVLLGTTDGGVGQLIPVEEATYRRLADLHSAMCAALPHVAGLNPRAFRAQRFERPPARQRRRNIADGNLLWQYPSLDAGLQRELARAIGSTPESIIGTLQAIDSSASFF